MFIASLLALALTALYLAKIAKMPTNLCLLFLVQPLAMSAYPLMVFIGGILGSRIAPDPTYATLPLTTMILTTAASAPVAAMLSKRFGRRNASLFGLGVLFLGALLGANAAANNSFISFLAASGCLGLSMAFLQQLRFAAMESVEDKSQAPKVLSVLLFAGIFAAVLGPEVALLARHWLIDSTEGYAGSFLGVAVMVAASMMIMTGFKNPQVSESHAQGPTRPLTTIMKQPIFIVAVISGAIGYGLMSYIMTATPISMHEVNGHSLEHTKWVIQSHIAAMYLPSLVTPFLVAKLGLKRLMLLGSIVYFIVASIALAGQQLMHYWWALVLLGFGWNLLFLTGTALLPQSYQPQESHKVQAVNDFLVFLCQGLFSLLAGWLLFKAGWDMVVYISIPLTLLVFVSAIYFYRMDSGAQNAPPKQKES